MFLRLICNMLLSPFLQRIYANVYYTAGQEYPQSFLKMCLNVYTSYAVCSYSLHYEHHIFILISQLSGMHYCCVFERSWMQM